MPIRAFTLTLLVSIAALADEVKVRPQVSTSDDEKTCEMTFKLPRGVRASTSTKVNGSGQARRPCQPVPGGMQKCWEGSVSDHCHKVTGFKDQECTLVIKHPCWETPDIEYTLDPVKKVEVKTGECPKNIDDAKLLSCTEIKIQNSPDEPVWRSAQLGFGGGILDACEINADSDWHGFGGSVQEGKDRMVLTAILPCSVIRDKNADKASLECKAAASNAYSAHHDLYVGEKAARAHCRSKAEPVKDGETLCPFWSCPPK
jgi:hypothetical protein